MSRALAVVPDEDEKPNACQSVGPEVMFPEPSLPNDHPAVMEAKRVCWGCPNRTDCLNGALSRREEWGVWGGLSTKERRAMIRRSNRLTRGQTETLMDVAL